MKNKSIVLAVSLFLGIYSWSLAHPVYTGYSGAPGSRGMCASSCHGTSGGTIEISGFPPEYLPGETYTITISHSGGVAIKQFNGSCRIGTGSDAAGEISAGTNTATYSRAEETNGVHFSTNDHDDATFLWTAPTSGAGEVRLYIAGHQGSRTGANSTLMFVSHEISTGFEDEISDLPAFFALRGNYPNPFNAATAISFSIREAADVTVEIYDIMGRRIETLIEGTMPAGEHRVVWDASDQPSGVYHCSLRAAGRSESIKLVLLK